MRAVGDASAPAFLGPITPLSRARIIIQEGDGTRLGRTLCLLIDIWSMKAFVWIARSEWRAPRLSPVFLRPGTADLADYHRLKGRTAKAERLAAIAEAHYQAAPDADEPPEAAAMAMPVPRPPVITNAVSTTRMTKPTGGRTAGLMPPAAP